MKRVLLIFRAPRPAANFSIEASFATMQAAFDGGGELALAKWTSSFLSSGLWSRLRGMLEVAGQRADVYHVTGDVHFLSLALPRSRTVLTIHDVGFLTRGRTALQRWILKKLWLDLPVRHCSVVTAVSEATRAEIIRHTGCPPEKIVVVPTVIPQSLRPVPKAFNEDCPTVLHIGMAPNKNFFRHVEALAGLRCKLRIVGRLDEKHLEHLRKHAIDYSAAHSLSNEQVRDAYEACDIVLFASTLEGFGMPIIEANTVERVVVTSNLSSMPEIAGSAACLVDPYRVESIREGLLRVMSDSEYREQLLAAGRENRSRFTPAAVANQYREIYARVSELKSIR